MPGVLPESWMACCEMIMMILLETLVKTEIRIGVCNITGNSHYHRVKGR